ncbi:hypothetical protein WJX81_008404 [Elliptochloris bilobata]|uniref:Cation efflux protein transmembrane domain-containing protein n=1 Tax=Elliptochloris bilobata TaxID=381761 RepID=A0AAW1QCR7_9CHLO
MSPRLPVSSISLCIFGVDSLIEVASACLVLWRLYGNALDLRRERAAVLAIGALLVLLACTATVASIVALARREHPETAVFALAISSTSLVLLTAAWLAKRRLAKALRSAVLASDAACSFACARLAAVLLAGSVAFMVAPGAWWVDAAAALVLAAFFAKEGADMTRAALSPAFAGGGCGCG